MKKIAIIVFVLTVALGVNVRGVYAAESVLHPGMTPDSPFYFLDQFGEWVQDLFAFSDRAKAERSLEHATERVAELKKLSDDGKINVEHAQKLTQRYQALITEYNDQVSPVADESEIRSIQKISDELLFEHVDAFDSVYEDSSTDVSKEVENELIEVEQKEDDSTVSKLQDTSSDQAELETKVERKMSKAQNKITRAQLYADSLTGSEKDVALAQITRAQLFLNQAQDALASGELYIAYGLAKQAKEIAEDIKHPEKFAVVYDKVSKDGYEEMLRAEQEVQKILLLIESGTLSAADAREAEAQLEEAIRRLAESKEALSNDEFTLGTVLAKYTQRLTQDIKNQYDSSSDDSSDDVTDVTEEQVSSVVSERLTSAQEAVTEAEQKIAEKKNEGINTTTAEAYLAKAQALLINAQSAYDAGDYILAATLARDAKRAAQTAKEDRVLDGHDDGDIDDEGVIEGSEDDIDEDRSKEEQEIHDSFSTDDDLENEKAHTEVESRVKKEQEVIKKEEGKMKESAKKEEEKRIEAQKKEAERIQEEEQKTTEQETSVEDTSDLRDDSVENVEIESEDSENSNENKNENVNENTNQNENENTNEDAR